MLQISNIIQPPDDILKALKDFQDEIDKLLTFDAKRKAAKDLFKSKNKKGNTVFDAIKVTLKVLCPGIERCVYCEDSQCDEVEHFHPKDLYPQFCFKWANYFYACGICNGPKNNQFAIFRSDNGRFHKVNPKNGKQSVNEPPTGDSVLINPRIDNPLDFCRLDLKTFKFTIIASEGTKDYARADYTYNTVLRLNDQRESLRRQREVAYSNYKSRLHSYSTSKVNNAEQNRLNTMILNLKRESHPTVWKEMQRQFEMNILSDDELIELFQQSPEALGW